MAFVKTGTTRNGIIYDDATTGKKRFVSAVGPLHYESVEGSGNYDTPLNFTANRVNTAALNGWRITDSEFHYALQSQDATGAQAPIGTVGYGGRRGSHWFTFRLQNLGYLHRPSRNLDDIGGAPTYTPAQLSKTDNTQQIGLDTLTTGTSAEWRNIWNTPGGGEVYLQWRISQKGLKEEIVINQAAREWIAANRPPGTAAAQTYFGFRFAIDPSDIPRVYRNAILQDKDGDFDDDDGDVELRDNVDNLLGFMPIDKVYVPNRGGSVTLQKRWYKDGANYWLMVAAKVSDLTSLLPGDLIFDPSITQETIGANNDDCYQSSNPTTEAHNSLYLSGYNNKDYLGSSSSYGDLNLGYRFQTVPIPQGATIDSATIQIYVQVDSSPNENAVIWGDDVDDAGAWADSSGNRPRGVAKTTASTSWDISSLSSASYNTSPTIKAIIEEIVGRAGWASNQDLRLALFGGGSGNAHVWCPDFNGGGGNYALLDATYTEAASNPTPSETDGVTVAEDVTMLLPVLKVIESEAVTVSDATPALSLVQGTLAIDESEAVTVAEVTSALLPILNVIEEDAITVADTPTVSKFQGILTIAELDAVTVAEEHSALLPTLAVNEAEAITVADDAPTVSTLQDTLAVTALEPITVSDLPSALLPELNAITLDAVTVAEQTVSHIPFLTVSELESLNVSEQVSVLLPTLLVGELEALSVGDQASVLLPTLLVEELEAVTVGDTPTMSGLGGGGNEGGLIQVWRNFGHYASIALVLSLGLGLGTPVYGDTADITFYFTEPTKNSDNTDLNDLKEFTGVFTEDGQGVGAWASDVTVAAKSASGGKLNKLTATLTYPNGSSTSGTMSLTAVDVNDNASAATVFNITAQLSPAVGVAPDSPIAIGACTP